MNLASMKYDLTYFKFYVKALFHLQTKKQMEKYSEKRACEHSEIWIVAL